MIPPEKRGMAWSLFSWVSLSIFFIIITFVYFHQLEDELDRLKENVF